MIGALASAAGGRAMSGTMEPTLVDRRDPLGAAIRTMFRDAGLRVGLLAAATITGVAWMIVFGLTWLPGAFRRTRWA